MYRTIALWVIVVYVGIQGSGCATKPRIYDTTPVVDFVGPSTPVAHEPPRESWLRRLRRECWDDLPWQGRIIEGVVISGLTAIFIDAVSGGDGGDNNPKPDPDHNCRYDGGSGFWGC